MRSGPAACWSILPPQFGVPPWTMPTGTGHPRINTRSQRQEAASSNPYATALFEGYRVADSGRSPKSRTASNTKGTRAVDRRDASRTCQPTLTPTIPRPRQLGDMLDTSIATSCRTARPAWENADHPPRRLFRLFGCTFRRSGRQGLGFSPSRTVAAPPACRSRYSPGVSSYSRRNSRTK